MSFELDQSQVRNAVVALIALSKKDTENQLLDEENFITLQLTTKIIPAKSKNPLRIPLKHSLYDSDQAQICLITKDPQEEYEKKIKAIGMDKTVTVISITKLRNEYKLFEAKRKLCASYDLFIADDRVMHMLPKLLGNKFYEKKKMPMAVHVDRNIRNEIAKIVDSTFTQLGAGSCCAFKVAHTGLSADQIVANVVEAVSVVISHIPHQGKNVQSIALKTATSISLPIYNSLPTEQFFQASEDAKTEKKEKQQSTHAMNNKTNKKRKSEEDDGDDTTKSTKNADKNKPKKSASDRPLTKLTERALKQELVSTAAEKTSEKNKKNNNNKKNSKNSKSENETIDTDEVNVTETKKGNKADNQKRKNEADHEVEDKSTGKATKATKATKANKTVSSTQKDDSTPPTTTSPSNEKANSKSKAGKQKKKSITPTAVRTRSRASSKKA